MLWYGGTDGAFSGWSLAVNGTYEPLLGDWNGDGRGDIFWYGPGAAPDVIWYGKASGGFTGRAVTVQGTYQPLVADFNGDRRRDILWYGPGADYDVLWLGLASGGFSSRATTVNGTYQPVLGDWNGDRSRDILVRARRRPRRPLVRAPGRALHRRGGQRRRHLPAVHRRLRRRRTARHLLVRAGSGYDVVWYGRSDGSFGAAAATVGGTYQPYVGDYGGDGPNDVFWYAPGGPDDYLWFGHANRRFTSRGTTLDIGYTRAPPLRPQALTSGYNPYGFVAHAFGAIDGRGYTNSLEAFQRNYGRGFRVFESTWSAWPTGRPCWPTTGWRPTTA